MLTRQQKLLAQRKDQTVRNTIHHTLDVIGHYGIEGVTTKRISERTKMSTAILHHHFGTKDNVIYESYLYFIEDIRRQASVILKTDLSAYELLKEFGLMHFSDIQTSHVAAKIWLSFWLRSSEDKRVARLLTIYTTRFLSNTTYLFRKSIIIYPGQGSQQIPILFSFKVFGLL